MKLSLKSVIRYENGQFDVWDNNQIIFSIGNFLCIRQLDRPQCQFVTLDKKMDYLYCFKTAIHKKPNVLTVERSNNNIFLCSYALNGDRKAVHLTDGDNFLPISDIISFNLFPDELQPSAVYGCAKTKSDSVVFLVDIIKCKLMGIGYCSFFQDMKIIVKQIYGASICGKGFLKVLKPWNGSWQMEDKLAKKIGNQNIVFHEWTNNLQDYICCSSSQVFVVKQMDVIQTIPLHSTIAAFKKIPHGVFVMAHPNKVILFSHDSDFLLSQGQKEMQSQGTFAKAVLSDTKDTIVISTNTYEIFSWKTECLQSTNQTLKFQFTKHQRSISSYKEGTIVVSHAKSSALLVEGNSWSLWDLEKNVAQLTMQMVDVVKIESAGISPDGHSMILAVADRVRLYKILLETFKCYGQFPLKKCRMINYCHGGQLVACCCGKGLSSTISIINTVYLKQILVIKHIDAIHLVWNQYDDQLAICTRRNSILCYKISQKCKLWELDIGQSLNFMRFDYLTGRLLASSNNRIYSILNDKTYEQIVPKVPNFHFVFPIEGHYIASTKNGWLYWSSSVDFSISQDMKLFNGLINLVYKKDRLIAYSSLSEVLVLSCGKGIELKKSLESQIGLIEKEQINKVLQKVRILQTNVENLQSMMFMKIEQNKRIYNQQLDEAQTKFTKEIKNLEEKHQSAIHEITRQQKGFNKTFNQLEEQQINNLHLIEKLYDEKIRLANEKYLDLEQSSLEAKILSDKLFKELQLKHSKDITNIRKEYQAQLTAQVQKMEKKKDKQIQYQKKMETIAINLEQQSQLALFNLQMSKDQQIKTLIQKINKQQRLLDNSNVQKGNLQENYNQNLDQYKITKRQLTKNENKLKQYVSRIKLLEDEIKIKNQMIQQRNIKIQQQSEQIMGLEKAKYVLSFRTTQVRKQLEPKQSIIEKLKEQLFKVDEEYKKEKEKSFKINQRVQKLQKLIQFTKKQLEDTKKVLKFRTRKHQELSSQIFKMVNSTDQSKWPSLILQIYKNHVQNIKHEIDGKIEEEDTISHEMNRNLIHLQKSLIQINTRNQKALKGTSIDKARKMKQNADLIFDLNNMRKLERQYYNQIQQKNIEIDRLKRQLSAFGKSRRNSTTAQTTRRQSNRGVFSRQSYTPNLQFQLNVNNIRKTPQIHSQRQRVFSASNTMILKDPLKKSKHRVVVDLSKELEIANNMIRRQDKMIEELNQRLLGLNQNITE